MPNWLKIPTKEFGFLKRSNQTSPWLWVKSNKLSMTVMFGRAVVWQIWAKCQKRISAVDGGKLLTSSRQGNFAQLVATSFRKISAASWVTSLEKIGSVSVKQIWQKQLLLGTGFEFTLRRSLTNLECCFRSCELKSFICSSLIIPQDQFWKKLLRMADWHSSYHWLTWFDLILFAITWRMAWSTLWPSQEWSSNGLMMWVTSIIWLFLSKGMQFWHGRWLSVSIMSLPRCNLIAHSKKGLEIFWGFLRFFEIFYFWMGSLTFLIQSPSGMRFSEMFSVGGVQIRRVLFI